MHLWNVNVRRKSARSRRLSNEQRPLLPRRRWIGNVENENVRNRRRRSGRQQRRRRNGVSRRLRPRSGRRAWTSPDSRVIKDVSRLRLLYVDNRMLSISRRTTS